MAGHETDETDGVDLGLKKMGDAGIAQVLAFFQPNRKKKLQVGSIKLGNMTFN